LAPNLVAQVAKTFVSKLSHGFQMVLRRSGSADIDQQIDDAPTPCPEMAMLASAAQELITRMSGPASSWSVTRSIRRVPGENFA